MIQTDLPELIIFSLRSVCMKHKYVFSKDTATGELMIREYAELSKEIFSPVCETVYDVKQFETALAQGPATLMAEMRTRNFYPPSSFSEKIILGISSMISSGGQEMVEIYCDDAEFLTKSLDGQEAFETIEDSEDETLDEFIEEDLPDSFNGDVKTGTVASTDIDAEDNSPEGEEG
jgi:hypothetical protein